MDAASLFHEEQRFYRNPWALFALLAGCGGVAIAIVVLWEAGVAAGFHPMGLLGFAVGGGVLLLLACSKLRIEVKLDALYVRFFPFTREHRFGWDEIVRAEARTYRPIRDYGGWGVRFGGGAKVYNVHGNRGVELEFRDGSRLMLGSQRADQLASTITSARGSS